MRDEKSKRAEKRSSGVKRRFYQLTRPFSTPPLLELENRHVVAPDTGVLEAPPGRGFPSYSQPPRFVCRAKRGWRPAPRDFELFHHFWLVSDRTKAVFEEVDPDGFAFAACEVRLERGHHDGPNYWLCDMVRVLDALDETRSRLKIGILDDPKHGKHVGEKYYSTVVPGGAKLVFREEVIASAHVFRMAHKSMTVIADETLKDACKAAGLTGIKFRDASKL